MGSCRRRQAGSGEIAKLLIDILIGCCGSGRTGSDVGDQPPPVGQLPHRSRWAGRDAGLLRLLPENGEPVVKLAHLDLPGGVAAPQNLLRWQVLARGWLERASLPAKANPHHRHNPVAIPSHERIMKAPCPNLVGTLHHSLNRCVCPSAPALGHRWAGPATCSALNPRLSLRSSTRRGTNRIASCMTGCAIISIIIAPPIIPRCCIPSITIIMPARRAVRSWTGQERQ